MKLDECEWDVLEEWIDEVFITLIEQRISNTLRWCPKWSEHPEVVARLWILYLGWKQVTEHGSALDFSEWMTDHLDSHVAQIIRADGPFAGCSLQRHRPLTVLPFDKRVKPGVSDSTVVQLHK